MPCLSSRYDVGVGPLVNLGVIASGAITPDAQSISAAITAFPALIDTGATVTCISPIVAQTLNLEPIGMRSMVSATQAVPVKVYLVDMIFPFGNAGSIFPNAQVMEFSPEGNCPFQILIGRDIICKGSLTISFDGHFTFCL